MKLCNYSVFAIYFKLKLKVQLIGLGAFAPAGAPKPKKIVVEKWKNGVIVQSCIK